MLPDVHAFFSPHGIEPVPPTHNAVGVWGLLNTFPDYSVAIALYVALLVASVCLLVGYRTRLASIVVFVGILSFEHRAPSIGNSGDGLLRNVTFFLMLAPAGASLSVDRWRRARDRFWEFPARAPWALRLVQIQLSVVYLSAVWLKLHAPAWLHGTAVSYSARIEDFARYPLPVRAQPFTVLQQRPDLLDDRGRAHDRHPRVEPRRPSPRAGPRASRCTSRWVSTWSSASSVRRCSRCTSRSSLRRSRAAASWGSATAWMR